MIINDVSGRHFTSENALIKRGPVHALLVGVKSTCETAVLTTPTPSPYQHRCSYYDTGHVERYMHNMGDYQMLCTVL